MAAMLACGVLVGCRGHGEAQVVGLQGVVHGVAGHATRHAGPWCDRVPPSTGSGVPDVLVRVVDGPGGSSTATAEVALRDCQFQPRVVVVEPGQPLRVHDDDPILHVLTPGQRALVPHASHVEIMLPTADEPQRLGCALHPWESAWAWVRPSLWAVVSDAQGRFALPSLPSGRWQLEIWHEENGRVRQTRQAVTSPSEIEVRLPE